LTEQFIPNYYQEIQHFAPLQFMTMSKAAALGVQLSGVCEERTAIGLTQTIAPALEFGALTRWLC